MDEQRLNEIERRANAATPGPWTAASRDVSGRLDSNERSGLGWELDGPPEPDLRGQFARGEDALFLAHARADIPDLIAEVRRLRAEIEDLEVDAAWRRTGLI